MATLTMHYKILVEKDLNSDFLNFGFVNLSVWKLLCINPQLSVFYGIKMATMTHFPDWKTFRTFNSTTLCVDSYKLRVKKNPKPSGF